MPDSQHSPQHNPNLEKRLDDADRQIAELSVKIRELENEQRALLTRVSALENSRIFRFARWAGKPLLAWKAKAGQRLLRSRLHPLYLKIRPPRAHIEQYEAWVVQNNSKTAPPEWHRAETENFSYKPVISIVMPTYNPRPEWFREAVESVREQSYRNWQLCISDDCSSERWVSEDLDEISSADSRIKILRSLDHEGIAAATNSAKSVVEGDYVGFLDQDDLLDSNALYHVVNTLQQRQPDVLYSDEDRVDSAGRPVEPLFKPGWSPDLLTSCMYLGHLLVVARPALDRAGWFRSEYDGSQDYDLALRLTDMAAEVQHIPKVLYHWRAHAQSTSSDPASKPYTHDAGRRALRDAVRRRKYSATVEDGPFPNTYHLRWDVREAPLVSIVICSRNVNLLKRCLKGIEKTTSYRHREVIVVQHVSGDDAAMESLLSSANCVHVRFEGAFHFAKMNNLGAARAKGGVLVFLNDDTVPLAPDWLRCLVGQTLRPEVGVVGGKLLYPSGMLQHAGIAIGIMDGCGHPERHGSGRGSAWKWSLLTRNVSAVTGACLAIRKEVFQELDGFRSAFAVNYNDVDLCLRAQRAGYWVIIEPGAELRHDECQTRVARTTPEERTLFYREWGEELSQADPFYNPNLTTIREDASLRFEG